MAFFLNFFEGWQALIILGGLRVSLCSPILFDILKCFLIVAEGSWHTISVRGCVPVTAAFIARDS